MFKNKNKIITISLVILAVIMCLGASYSKKNTFAVYEGDDVTVFSSHTASTSDALASAGFVIGEDKYTEMPEMAKNGMAKIYIYNKNKVNLKIAETTTVLYSQKEETLEDLLKSYSVSLGEYDTISLPLTTPITDGLEVEIVRVSHSTREETVSVPFATEKKPSQSMYKGTSKVVQKGQNGSKKQTFQVVTTNGVETSKKLLSETVIKEPVAQIVEYGTKKKETSGFITTKSGEKLEYKNVLNMTATAYTTERTSDKITATGQVARVGLVAVDRKVIPLGTKLYIVAADGKSWCYGVAVAGDTGVRGNKIDLFFNTYNECISFGRRKATVYILK
ncbi:MAG: G5 domain-containing protein [Oscillospiraceae bacterium]|nr:G5 domain-containing protein [Oscillospiraceae bacterium]